MNTTFEINQLNQFLRAHHHGLLVTEPAQMPTRPLVWLVTHCLDCDFRVLMSVLMLLLGRGASAEECGRYTCEPSVSLPFAGYEQQLFDQVLAELAEIGYSSRRIAGIVEMSCVAIEGAVRMGNFGAFKRAFENGS